MRRKVFGSVLVVCMALVLASPAAAEHHEKSLYDRLGGVYPIALVVDDFIDRVVDNDTLNANPAIYAARDENRFPGLKFQVTALLIQVTGGPYEYHGRTMKESHKDLHITEAEWEAMAADFKATLEAFQVPEAEQSELFEIVDSTHDDIVTRD